jgi:squalene-hopene/tetraprenyl-beta-curcumene cyclase
MLTRVLFLVAIAAGAGFAEDWNPKLAADYLDARQQAWIAWPVAIHDGAPCISCHTNLTYLLARPVLSAALRQPGPTPYQAPLTDSLRRGLGKKSDPASQSLGTETVLAAFLLASEDARRGKLTPDTERALARLWAFQIADGKNKGGWSWFSLSLEPWEEPESAFFAASLGALAVGTAPGGYASRPDIRDNLDRLKAYLNAEQALQPLHNRLMLAWASSKWPGLLSDGERKAIVDSAFAKQRDDGGWSIESLGPFRPHPNAPPSEGSNAYATAIAAFTLQQSGVPRSIPAMQRALEWLRTHQDPKTGSWPASSMNKRYEPGSMQVQFMSDAATGFAVLALLPGQ